jgi:hypothetical protein
VDLLSIRAPLFTNNTAPHQPKGKTMKSQGIAIKSFTLGGIILCAVLIFAIPEIKGPYFLTIPLGLGLLSGLASIICDVD